MNLYVYVKRKKNAGVFTNDRRLIKHLRKHPEFEIWYIILKKGKLYGVAFLTKHKSLIKDIKEFIRKWKRKVRASNVLSSKKN